MRHSVKRVLAMLVAVLLALPLPAFSEAVQTETETNIVASETLIGEDATSQDVEAPVEEVVIELEGEGEEFPEQPDQEPSDTPAETAIAPFEQVVTLGGATVTVTAAAGALPEGASVRVEPVNDAGISGAVEAAISVEGVYAHRLYRVEVLDEAKHVILPDHEQGVPTVRVAGLNLPANARVAVYDENTGVVRELAATVAAGRNAIEFGLVDAGVYDIYTIAPLPEQAEEGNEGQSEEATDAEGTAEATSSVTADAVPPSPEGKAFGDEPATEGKTQETESTEVQGEEAIEATTEPSPSGEGAERSEAEEVVFQEAAEAQNTSGEAAEAQEATEEAAEGQEAPEETGEQEGLDGEILFEDGLEAAPELSGFFEASLMSSMPAMLASAGADDTAQQYTVSFSCDPEGAAVTVYPAVSEDDPEPEAIAAQGDGTYLLSSGVYSYTAEAEGYEKIENELFEVEDADLTVSVHLYSAATPVEGIATWADLQAAIDDANSGDRIIIGTDITADGTEEGPLTISKRITLDLNGYTLDRGLGGPEPDGCVICVDGGSLTIIGTVTEGDDVFEGVITGGYNEGNGGGIVVKNSGSLTVNGAKINSNRTEGNGGGIYVDASSSFTLIDSVLEDNEASEGKAGGIYNESAIALKGSRLAYNQPVDACLDHPIHISGAVEIDNLLVAEGKDGNLIVRGPLPGSAQIQLSLPEGFTGCVVTSKLKGRGSIDNFRMYDVGELDVSLNDDGEAVVGDFATVMLYKGDSGIDYVKRQALRGKPYSMPECPFEGSFQGWMMEDGTIKQPGDTVDIPETGDVKATATWGTTWASFQETIDSAGYGETIVLPSDLVRETANDYLTIVKDKKVTIDLAGHKLDGAGTGDKAVIYVEGGELIVKDSVGGGKITGGSMEGGVVVNSGAFTLLSGEISNNTANTGEGGGVQLRDGAFTMRGGVIADNTASKSGGGVGVTGGTFEMKGGEIRGNQAQSGKGGGIDASGGKLLLKGGTITNNNASQGGGVSVQSDATFEMTGGVIGNNTAESNGGGLWLGVDCKMEGGEIRGNQAVYGGGVYANDKVSLTLVSPYIAIADNQATVGGGVYVSRGAFSLESGAIENNTATQKGGGLYVAGSSDNGTATGKANLYGGAIRGNQAQYGGGAYFDTLSEGAVVMPTNIIEGNTAGAGGGGLGIRNMILRLPDVDIVTGNHVNNDSFNNVEQDYWLESHNSESGTVSAAFNVTSQLPAASRVYVWAGLSSGANRVIATGVKLNRNNFVCNDNVHAASRDVEGNMLLGNRVTVFFDPGEGTATAEKADDYAVMGGAYTMPKADEYQPKDPGQTLHGWTIDNPDYWDKTTKAAGSNVALTAEMLRRDGALYLVAAWGTGVTYEDENQVQRTAFDVRELSDYRANHNATLDTGWYVADGGDFVDRLEVNGTVNLIIDTNTATNMLRGIEVGPGNELHIWGKGGWATDGSQLVAAGLSGNAGIGGSANGRSGTVVVHSGKVEATGGSNAAGIGGGSNAANGTVTILGGKVTARGGSGGAGIGGGGATGGTGGDGGKINLYGGDVEAVGGENAAGIGGGSAGNGAQLEIDLARVVARGGRNGAGIGGGKGGSGGAVSVSSGSSARATAGDIEAGATSAPQAIGSGHEGASAGSLTVGDSCVVKAGDSAGSAAEVNKADAAALDAGRAKKYLEIVTPEGTAVLYSIKNTALPDDATLESSRKKEGEAQYTVASEAEFGDEVKLVYTLADYRIYKGIELSYLYHGENVALTEEEDYQLALDDPKSPKVITVTFTMPRGSVTVAPSIEIKTSSITVITEEGEGNGGAYVNNQLVTRVPVGAEVQLRCTPRDEDWFLDVDNALETPCYVYTDGDGVEHTGLTLPVGTSETVRKFTMPAYDVVVKLKFLKGVHYIDADGKRKLLKYYRTVDSDATWKSEGRESSFYYADQSMTFTERPNITNQVDLIIDSGVTLTFSKGIQLSAQSGGKLNIYVTELGGDGALKADASSQEYCAGIGGNDGENGGNVAIYGGRVTANGGKYAAGIGGGRKKGLGVEGVTAPAFKITAGSVTAQGGEYAAGIGGGRAREDGSVHEGLIGEAIITGGEVWAYGGEWGAGIGGGQSQDQGCAIRISGGRVTAKGGSGGAGIGGGEESSGTSRRVGGNFGEIDISGGVIYATGGKYGAGIGGGDLGGSTRDRNHPGVIRISGGYIEATGKHGGAGIGTGDEGYDGEIHITGGIVKAEGDSHSATGIGGGGGSLLRKQCGAVKVIEITGGEIHAKGNERAIGRGGYGTKDFTTLTLGGGASVKVGKDFDHLIGPGHDDYDYDSYEKAVQDQYAAEIIFCGSHDYQLSGYEYASTGSHYAIKRCTKCGATRYETESHHYDDEPSGYEYASADSHYVIRRCTKCGATKYETERHHYTDEGAILEPGGSLQHYITRKCVCGSFGNPYYSFHYYTEESGNACASGCGYIHPDVTVTIKGGSSGNPDHTLKGAYNSNYTFPEEYPYALAEGYYFKSWTWSTVGSWGDGYIPSEQVGADGERSLLLKGDLNLWPVLDGDIAFFDTAGSVTEIPRQVGKRGGSTYKMPDASELIPPEAELQLLYWERNQPENKYDSPHRAGHSIAGDFNPEDYDYLIMPGEYDTVEDGIITYKAIWGYKMTLYPYRESTGGTELKEFTAWVESAIYGRFWTMPTFAQIWGADATAEWTQNNYRWKERGGSGSLIADGAQTESGKSRVYDVLGRNKLTISAGAETFNTLFLDAALTPSSHPLHGANVTNKVITKEFENGVYYKLPNPANELFLTATNGQRGEGISFIGWLVHQKGEEATQYTVMQPGEQILTDDVDKITAGCGFYTHYDANGGSGAMPSAFRMEGYDSATYALPQCAFDPPEGRQFAYWKAEKMDSSYYNGTNERITDAAGNAIAQANAGDTITVPILYQVTWKAVWAYPVILESGGETKRVGFVTPGESYTLPGFSETFGEPKDGMTFMHWENDSTPGAHYLPGQTFTVGDAAPSFRAVLSVKVSFDLAPSTKAWMSDRLLATGSEFALPKQPAVYGGDDTAPKDATGEYLSVIGWTVVGDATNTVHYCGETITVNGPMKLKAVWGYKVSFNPGAHGMGTMPEAYFEQNGNNRYTLPECGFARRDQYVFAGWSVKVGSAAAVNKKPGDEVYISSSAVVTALWETGHIVTFDANGGSAVAAQTVLGGEKAAKPSDPTRDGYGFAGWYNGDNAFDFTTPITADLTLTAKWVKLLKVNFDPNRGSAVAAQMVPEGGKATRPVDPTRNGYVFAGWYNRKTLFDFDTPITAKLTLTAQWTKGKTTSSGSSSSGSSGSSGGSSSNATTSAGDATKDTGTAQAQPEATLSKGLIPLSNLEAGAANATPSFKAHYGEEEDKAASLVYVLDVKSVLREDITLDAQRLGKYRMWDNGQTQHDVALLPNATRLFTRGGLDYVSEILVGDVTGDGRFYAVEIFSALNDAATAAPVIPIGSMGSLDFTKGTFTVPAKSDFELYLYEISGSWLIDRIDKGQFRWLDADQDQINSYVLEEEGAELPGGQIVETLTEDAAANAEGVKRYWLGDTPETASDDAQNLIYLLVDPATDEVDAFRTSRAMIAAGEPDIDMSVAIYRDSKSDRMGEEKYNLMFVDTPEDMESEVAVITNVLEGRELEIPKTLRVTLRSFELEGADHPAYGLSGHLFAMEDATDGTVEMFDDFYTATFDGDVFDSEYTRIEGISSDELELNAIIKKGQSVWPEWTGEAEAEDIQGDHFIKSDDDTWTQDHPELQASDPEASGDDEAA